MVSILSILILSFRNRGWDFLLNRQNTLSVTKIICRQSLKIWKKQVLMSSKLRFNFESSAWTVEIIRTRFSCPFLLDFLKNLFFLKNLNYGRSMGSDAIALNFFNKLDSTKLFHVGFGEIRFLKWHDVINSKSWFLTIFQVCLYSS